MTHVLRGAMVVAAGLGMLWAGMALAGPTDADKCEADKLKRAGKYAFCRMKAEGKAVKKSEAPDYTKCNDKIVEQFGKAETKWGVECPTLGDVGEIQDQVTAYTDDLAVVLSGGTLPGGIGSDRVGCLCGSFVSPTGLLEACIENPTCDAPTTKLVCDRACMALSGDSSALEACAAASASCP